LDRITDQISKIKLKVKNTMLYDKEWERGNLRISASLSCPTGFVGRLRRCANLLADIDSGTVILPDEMLHDARANSDHLLRTSLSG